MRASLIIDGECAFNIEKQAAKGSTNKIDPVKLVTHLASMGCEVVSACCFLTPKPANMNRAEEKRKWERGGIKVATLGRGGTDIAVAACAAATQGVKCIVVCCNDSPNAASLKIASSKFKLNIVLICYEEKSQPQISRIAQLSLPLKDFFSNVSTPQNTLLSSKLTKQFPLPFPLPESSQQSSQQASSSSSSAQQSSQQQQSRQPTQPKQHQEASSSKNIKSNQKSSANESSKSNLHSRSPPKDTGSSNPNMRLSKLLQKKPSNVELVELDSDDELQLEPSFEQLIEAEDVNLEALASHFEKSTWVRRSEREDYGILMAEERKRRRNLGMISIEQEIEDRKLALMLQAQENQKVSNR